MAFEITGKLYKKFDTETRGEKGFMTRDLVLEILDGNYPQLIKFQMVAERCAILDTYNEGEEIKVHFDLRGREWQGKFLTNLNCWRIEKSSGESAKPVQQVAASDPATQTSALAKSSTPMPSLANEPMQPAVDDDLPF